MKWRITAKLNDDVAQHEGIAINVTQAVERFAAGDWGDVPAEDKEANDRDLATRCGHVLGRYKSLNGDLYINMEFAEDPADDTAVIMYRYEY